jgi:signal transduction histidine kinase
MESGTPQYDIIESHIRSNGASVQVRTNKVPLKNADGAIIGILGTFEDITDRKRMEEQLFKAQKLESLGLLAGGIAHDFNNLMGGLFGYIDLALAASNDAEVKKYLSSAISGIDRARSLTTQLLTFAKGGVPIRQINDVRPTIREAATLALRGANVSCEFNFFEDLWPCIFDKNQINQVIHNMVLNAREAMPAGGIVTISAANIHFADSAKQSLNPGNYVRISVHDDGVGIPEQFLSKIFDPFFTSKQEGSGLGLSICHSIVKKHGGRIDVDSATDRGTTFHFFLPAPPEPLKAGSK